ncbi:AGROH133_08824 family phage infection protein [Pseudorhizobium sp. NPDC055634]
MELYFPTEMPERLAFLSALVVAGFGLLTMLFPARLLRAGGLVTGEITSVGFGATRSIGGLHLGLGLAAIALAQDFTYLMLGSALGFAAFGRLLSLFVDRGRIVINALVLIAQLVLAALPLGYVFGYF